MGFAAHLGPARIDGGLAVWRELNGKDVLAIIAQVVGDLARGESGGVRYPDVAFAFAVKNPLICQRKMNYGRKLIA